MKRLLALLLLLLAPSAFGQSVGASQIKKKVNAGIVADSANALAIGIYRGVTAPASPVTGQAWLDTTTTPAKLKTYTGAAWEISPTGAGITQTDLTAFPANPTDGQIVWVRSLKRAVIYDSTPAMWYYLDGVNRPAQADYSLAAAGFSSSFLPGPGATTGSVVAGGAMTAGTHLCAISVYSSTGGETMIGTPTATLTIAANATASLAFGAGGTGVAGKRVWCTKANQTNPFWLITTIDDATTTTYSVVIADGAFGIHVPPDKDFSAPIPSGWTYYNTVNATGGCGSTGTSLLCVSYGASAQTVGMVGPRLMYGITGSSNDWTATVTISRFTPGFTGTTATQTGACIVAFSTGNSVAAEVASQCWSQNNGSWPQFSAGNAYRYTRTNVSAWGAVAAYASTARLPSAVPFYWRASVFGTTGSWMGRIATSSNGRDWNEFPALATATEWRHVGMVMEATNGAQGGILVEITDLTFKNY